MSSVRCTDNNMWSEEPVQIDTSYIFLGIWSIII